MENCFLLNVMDRFEISVAPLPFFVVVLGVRGLQSDFLNIKAPITTVCPDLFRNCNVGFLTLSEP